MRDLQNVFSRFHDFLNRYTLVSRFSYHPERHYMRGPGPACRRQSDDLGQQA